MVLAGVLGGVLTLGGCGDDSAAALMASGKVFLAKKEPRKAVIQFKSALQQDPQSGEGRLLLGQALLASGDALGAVFELTKALDQRHDANLVMPPLAKAMLQAGGAKKLTQQYGNLTLPDPAANAALQAALAQAWGLQGDKARALDAMNAALAAVPAFPAALILQARMQGGQGQFDAALATVESVLVREPGNHEAWQLKGELLATARQDIAGAAAAYQRALLAEPAFIPSHLALITQHLAASDVAAARRQADQMRSLLPQHPQTLYVEARLALLDKDVKKARELAQQLLRATPDNAGVLRLAGTVESLAGALVLAESQLGRALQIDPTLVLARRNLAKTQLRLGQPAKALATLQPLLGARATDADALALAGEAQLQLGDAGAAEALFLQAARFNPDDPTLRTSLALIQLSRGEVEAAFARLDTIAASSADSAADMAIMSARLKRREYAAALRALDTMAKKRPGSASVAELRGQVHTARKDYAAARAAFEQALAIEPSRFSAVSSLAALDVMAGRLDEARQRLQGAVTADPRNHAARMALADLRSRQDAPLAEVLDILGAGIRAAPSEAGPRLQLVELLLAKKQFKDAVTAAQEAAASLPADTDIADALGRAQMLAGDTQQAISTYRRLAGQDTRSARPHLRLAELMKRTGDRDATVAALRRALEVDPNNEAAQSWLVDMLVADGRPKDALDMARSMQLRTPLLASGYLLEGAVQRRLKAPEAAIEAYRNGLERAVVKSDLAVALHKALLLGKHTAEADRLGASWMKAHPNDASFEYHLATVSILRNQLDTAEVQLARVLVQLPNHPMALNNLAWVLASRGKPGAIEHARRAVELLPNRPALMDTLALALAADKQLPKALEMQRSAIAIAPGDMGLRLNLAKIAIQAGDKTLARNELQRLAAQGSQLAYHGEVSRLLKTL
jgi:cellulose synthase operon protein C